MSKSTSSNGSELKTQFSTANSTWPLLFFVLLALSVFAFAWNPLMGGDDFWGHAAIGRWAIDHRAVPHRTLFLWSADIPWIYHAYGSGVVFATLLETGGPALALAFNCFASLLPFALIWVWWRKNRPFATVVALFLLVGIWISCVRWHLRPELFTVNFLTLLMLFFLREKRPLWLCGLIVAMFAIWPNMHGGCLMGLILIWGTAFAELFDDRKKGLSMLLLAVICTAALFIGSPYHLHYPTTWRDIGGPVFMRIDEWKPFWWHPILAPEVVGGVFLVWGTAFFLWLKSPEKKIAHLMWLALFGLAFVMARRQLWLVCVASLLVLAIYSEPLQGRNLYASYNRLLRRGTDQFSQIPAGFQHIAHFGTCAILLCSLIAGITRDQKPFAIYDSKFPLGMANYLATKAPPGRMLNDYEYSASLQWMLYGKKEFYIDLINAYPAAILSEYFEVLDATSEGRAVLDKKNIDIVALRPRKKDETMNALVAFLNSDPRWRRTYNAVDGTVWVRVRALKNRNLALLPSQSSKSSS